MAKIVRKPAKQFGSAAGPLQIGQFGSLAAGLPTYSSDPTVLQALSEWSGGWFSAILGNNSPAIEDMNAFCFVMAYQIAYLMQEGIAEWDSATTYYKGSFAQDGNGKVYVSTFDGNLNNVLTDNTKWLPYISDPIAPTIQRFLSGSGNYNPTYMFTVATANATAGDTYTNNGQTFTVVNTLVSGTTLRTTGTGAPLAAGTLTRTSGSGDSTITFVAFKIPLYIEVELAGGGGGGSNANTSGSDGNDTTFGSSFLTAGKGFAGPTGQSPGTGGTNTIVGSVDIIYSFAGTGGAGGGAVAAASYPPGGQGGTNFLGGGGSGAFENSGTTSYTDGIDNTGGGGGGGSAGGIGAIGAGAGAGSYLKVRLSVVTSYAYSVGAGGASGGGTAGAGGDGVVIVNEFWQ